MAFDSEIEPGNTDTGDETAQLKQGHTYCGFCCDMRRAVMIVNAVNILFLLIITLAVAEADRMVRESDNDAEKEALDSSEKALRGVAIIAVFGWILSFVTIWGAIKFRVIPVALNALYMFIAFLATSTMRYRATEHHTAHDFDVGSWFINVFFLLLAEYPHIMYVIEVRSGILSAETYQREKRCCCR